MSRITNKSRLAMIALLAATSAGLPSFAQEKKPDQPGLQQLSKEEADKLKAQLGAKAAQTAQAAQPGATLPKALQIDGDTFDWGDISDAEPVSHSFNFKNVSDKKIKITVAASCGCTVAGLEKDTYEPGETGKITGTFNPQGRNGPQTKVLTMTVLDPQGVFAQQTMTLNSNVKALVQTEPPKMYLTDVDHKAGTKSKITVKSRKPEFKINAIESNNEFIKSTLSAPEVIDENGEKLVKYEIELEVGKGAPIGNLNGQLTFTTADEKVKVPTYYVGADVIGDMKATPPQAMLRVSNTSTPFQTQVRVDSRSGSAFNITSIDVEGRQDMKLVADAVKSDDGKYYMLTLSGVTPETPGIVNGTLVINTDSQGGEMIRVPFTAAVRKTEVAAPTVRNMNAPGAAAPVPPAGTPVPAKH